MIELKRGYITSEDWMKLEQDFIGRPKLHCLALSFQLEFAFVGSHDRDHWSSIAWNIFKKYLILEKMQHMTLSL